MIRCTSYMTRSASFGEYARKTYAPDSPAAKVKTWNGDNCVTLIQTANGAVIYLRFDIASPRPHHLTFYTLQGTGASYDDEAGVYVDGKTKGWEPIEQYYSKYDHPYWLRTTKPPSLTATEAATTSHCSTSIDVFGRRRNRG